MKKYIFFLFSFSLFISLFYIQKKRDTSAVTTQTLKVNISYSPYSLDPRTSTDPVTATLHLMLFEGLTRLNQDGTTTLCLAKSYALSKDKMTYTFHLKKSCFSDGSPLTAYDFERSWKEAVSPDFIGRASELFFCIKNAKAIKLGDKEKELGVVAKDEYTLQVTLNHPAPYFLNLLSYPTFFPIHRTFSSQESKGNPLISNGPFQLKNKINNNKICLKKNPFFHHQKRVQLTHIELDVVSDATTSFYLFQKEQNHWFGGFLEALPVDSIQEILTNYTLIEKPTTGFCFCSVNVTNPILSNLNIRKALYQAMNPPSLIQDFPILAHETAMGPTPTQFWKTHNMKPLTIEINEDPLTLFNRGIDELGIDKKEFPSLNLIYFPCDAYKRIAQIFQQRLKSLLNIDLKLVVTPASEHYHKLSSQDYDLSISAWISQFNDPLNYLQRLNGTSNKNHPGWINTSFTKLLDKSLWADNQTARIHLLHAAESLIAEQIPLIPLYHFNLTYLQHHALKGVHISPLGLTDFRYAYFEKI